MLEWCPLARRAVERRGGLVFAGLSESESDEISIDSMLA